MEERRRYSESEVEEIFERATNPRRLSESSASAREGMTLAELQEIGREVGIPADAIERAAESLERSPVPRAAKERFLGLPVGVGRTFRLPRRLSDEEWSLLVTDLRDTFSFRGKAEVHGELRSWRIGNLRVRLEPDGAGGEVLRFQTEKSGARNGLGIGAGFLGGAVLLGTLYFVTGGALGAPAEDVLWIGLVGAGFLGTYLVRLPPWAGRRARQMEEIAARVVARIKSGDQAADTSDDRTTDTSDDPVA